MALRGEDVSTPAVLGNITIMFRYRALISNVDNRSKVWKTGYGKKLSSCQAQLRQAKCLDVALSLFISCGQSYVRRLYKEETVDAVFLI